MSSSNRSIGQEKFFTRARVSVRVHARTVMALFCIVFSAFASFAADPAFIRGPKGVIRGLVLDSRKDISTRKALNVLKACTRVKPRPTAMTLQGSEDSSLIPHVKAKNA